MWYANWYHCLKHSNCKFLKFYNIINTNTYICTNYFIGALNSIHGLDLWSLCRL